MKLTYKYKTVTKYATNLLMGVLCAYSVCACGGAQNIAQHNSQSDNERPDNNQYEDPTDTEQNEHDNNHDINDNQWEQPDENHSETPDEQNTPDNQWEQPDENHPETPDEQNTPDNQWEQGDEDHQDIPDEQNDQDNQEHQGEPGKCNPGYVWVDNSIDPWVIDDGISVNNQCVACASLPSLVPYLQYSQQYCPGGDDLMGKHIIDQLGLCPSYECPIDDLSSCYLPPSTKICWEINPGTRKPLIINPKVNVVPNHKKINNTMLLRNKIRERKVNKR